MRRTKQSRAVGQEPQRLQFRRKTQLQHIPPFALPSSQMTRFWRPHLWAGLHHSFKRDDVVYAADFNISASPFRGVTAVIEHRSVAALDLAPQRLQVVINLVTALDREKRCDLPDLTIRSSTDCMASRRSSVLSTAYCFCRARSGGAVDLRSPKRSVALFAK